MHTIISGETYHFTEKICSPMISNFFAQEYRAGFALQRMLNSAYPWSERVRPEKIETQEFIALTTF
jgi:hypothetical protein